MPLHVPIAPENASESVRSIYQRIQETIGQGQVPVGYQMMAHIEPFLQDSYMNYRKFIHEGGGKLDEKQRQAIVLATSSTMNCRACVHAHAQEAQAKGWSAQQVAEILAVVATCTMYNTYYKFRSLADDEAFKSMPAPGLRAHTFMKTSLDEPLVELINLVVSNINSCPSCTAGHLQKALKLGLTREHVDEALKVSAVIAGFNAFHRIQ